MDGAIASAVVLPEPEDSHPTASLPISQKRRQSSVSEQGGKRQRLSNNTSVARQELDAGDAAARAAPERPRPIAKPDDRERARGKRLFGAALGGLSSSSSTTAQRRRAEIEKKQQDKLKQRAEENGQRKKERLATLKAQRLKQQRKFDEDSMRIRHASMLNMAYFLKTDTEPRLFYKPWALTEEEEGQIKDQITETQDIIDREVADFEARRAEEDGWDQSGSRDEDFSRHENVDKVDDAKTPKRPNAINGTTNDSESIHPKNQNLSDDHANSMEHQAMNGARPTIDETQVISEPATTEENGREALDENGEEVEEAAEDTVIY